MTMNRIIIAAFAIFLVSVQVFAAPQPDAAQKAKVRSIIKEVRAISIQCDELEDFGRKTIEQGKQMLSVGPFAVYALSNCLDDPDWKVRFWITDMLGYLENPDARRPLMRVINNVSEEEQVRRQAESSLKKLDVPLERNIE